MEVKDIAGTSIGTASIAVDYGINNVSSDFYNWVGDHRNRLEMVDMDGQGGYTFEYNNNAPSAMNSMYGNSAAQDAFERAIETWRCNTGVNFDINDSGTSEGHAGDNGNIIIFQSISGGTLGVTTTRYSALANGACSMENTLWYLEEIDIRFNSNLSGGFTWNYGPGSASGSQFDFESTAVHELGHAHGLGHIVFPGKVMHYTLSNGVEIRSLSAEDIAAGSFKVAHSTQSNCIATPGPMTAVPVIDCALLPVELLNFMAYQQETSVLLDWETAREQENDYFSIERSGDGKEYVPLGEVTGAGYTSSITSYEFIDRAPLTGINYYRLKQTDFDGHTSYSPVRTVTFERPSTGIDIFPNPASSDQIDIIVGLDKRETSTIQFNDSAGKFFRVNLEQTASGFKASVGHLAPGVYFVSMISDHGTPVIRKFIKQ
ncbi:MAG: T9SS C-terminal target domain-containing protein [Bacteroidetes bacterium]|nr:MAG: T9SS C-terminal target domain-containing protein [Bacteroidota bacterium]